VTQRHKAEGALRLTQASIDVAAEMVAWFTPDGRVRYANDSTCRTLGYSRDELVQMTALDFTPGFTWEQYAEHWREVREKKSFTLEVTHRRKDGSKYPAEVLVNHVVYGGQEYIFAYGRDITSRKQAEEALRESEAKANALIKYAPTGIYEIDFRGPSFISVNDVMCQILGYTREELFSIGPVALLDEESRVRFLDRIRRQLAGEKIEETVEFRVRKKDGSLIDAILNVSLNVGGDPGRALVVAYDITQRKRMEEALRRARNELELRVQERTAEIQRQAQLIDLARDAIVLEEIDGTILLWNKGAAEMYGWEKEEALGRIMRELLKTEYPEPRSEIMPRFLTGGHWEGELTHTRKGGTKLKVLSRWVLKRTAGETDKIMILNHDITQRLKMEEELRHAQKMEALGTLSGGIAHDFNNLLMPILLNTEMAIMDVRAGELPNLESLETAMAGANRGKELVQQIITFSRHKGESLKPVDIAPITKETIKFLRSTSPAMIRFETHIEDPSPLVMANATQIHQVMINLVTNAVHAMEKDGGVLEITLEKVDKAESDDMKPGSYVCLKVKDTGCGMTHEVREKAFDPFFTTKAKEKGTGLGLAVVHGMVKKHGGEIRLESEFGKGTMVTVFLPVHEEVKKEEARSRFLGVQTGSERILFVDDEEIQTRTVETMLKRLGYRIVVESDPHKALEIFRGSRTHSIW
jgi:two-component system cell cycle sensor histidine kinase/response regulator CckA